MIMVIVLKCLECEKRFYISGEAEALFNKLSDAAVYLRLLGYRGADGSIWRVVQDRAKCCDSPNITTVLWEHKYEF